MVASLNESHAKEQQSGPILGQLERVKTITAAARTTWFGFLAAAAFAAITLSSVRDVDFFSADATTTLPFINIAVPVTAFFLAGAGLITIVYAYLHVFLEKLWRALGQISPRHQDEPIAHAIAPWIVSDFALALRRLRRPLERRDLPGNPSLNIAPTRRVPIAWSPLWIAGAGASFLLCWASGPAVVFYFWYRSMPAHEALLTVFIGICLAFCLAVMLASLATLNHHMRPAGSRPERTLHRPILTFLLMAALTIPVSYMRTVDDFMGFQKRRHPFPRQNLRKLGQRLSLANPHRPASRPP